MEYTQASRNTQPEFDRPEYLKIPSDLYGFRNTRTEEKVAVSGRTVYCMYGELDLEPEDFICAECGCARMHIHARPDVKLQHLCFGDKLSLVIFQRIQFFCCDCHAVKRQDVPFKAEGHRITEALYNYTRDLLAHETYTLKQVSEITGLGKNVVKDIDKKRLQEKYTIDGKTFIKPEHQAKYLGIDEFKLHNGRKYATHIIDMETGHILWIAEGKKKSVVYDFIDHVGMEWMEGVEAVACDMNSDFQEAFEERCEWIQPVFDYFHIVNNFNEKVIDEIRRDEQRRLIEEGNTEGAKSLKRTRYILTSSRSTLQKKDAEAAEGKVVHKGSQLIGTEDVVRKGGNEAKYDALLQENKLLFTVDLIKVKLEDAYRCTTEPEMADKIIDIIDICVASENKHLLWFGKLLNSHFEGIIAHATYKISAGKIEGINQKIKTLRRHGYGYPDDDYFFLKLFDASRQDYVRNPKSHRIND